ncbi:MULTISPECIES: hypothetical protein [unclassified Halomonas]|uniref:hypothetical protein n=1 Tax=unclassified Halomonas TaxID=2609666 RepID=UPI0020A08C7B|nr:MULTISPECIES: hypothetical protein [unclassified Halomonas]MCP1313004.1 hypothetical protein [Halomonas sp. 707D7]MCP1326096.1 hypothetical protein [Halomonas sp. 707D4]
MTDLIPLLASNALGVASGYLVARFSRARLALALPNIEPPLAAPLVMYPLGMSAIEAAWWLRKMAACLEAKERQKEGYYDAR